MRGLRNIINHFRHAKGNTTLVAGILFFGALAFGGFGLAGQQNAQAASGNDIVYGGIYNRDLASKCNGDVRTIMDHYRIDCNLAGVVDGRACKDNNVYVGDRIVARDAQSIGRQQKPGDHAISIGGQTYWEAPNSVAFAQQCIDAFVKLDQNGSFVYAILKPCGNPIWTPSPVVVPPPTPPKMIYVCELATKKIISIKESEYNPQTQSKDLDDCKEKKITVCELATKKIVTITEAEYNNNSSKYSKNLDDCKEKPQDITVCELTTKKIVTISQTEYNNNTSKYSKNLDDCKEKPKDVTVCELSTKKIVTISEAEYKNNTSKYSANLDDCKEDCTTNPKGPGCETPQLPQTGIGDGLMGAGVGLGSLIIAGSAYISSRKDLLSAFLNR